MTFISSPIYFPFYYFRSNKYHSFFRIQCTTNAKRRFPSKICWGVETSSYQPGFQSLPLNFTYARELYTNRCEGEPGKESHLHCICDHGRLFSSWFIMFCIACPWIRVVTSHRWVWFHTRLSLSFMYPCRIIIQTTYASKTTYVVQNYLSLCYQHKCNFALIMHQPKYRSQLSKV